MSHNINNLKKQRGLIKYIFYILAAILLLSYLGFNLKDFILSEIVQENISFVWGLITDVWKEYLKPIYDFLAAWFGPYISDTLDGLKNHNYDINNNVPKNLIPGVK